MAKKLSLATYIENELTVVYPKLPQPENATRSQRLWIFMKQDFIAYFAPARLLWRAFKAIIR